LTVDGALIEVCRLGSPVNRVKITAYAAADALPRLDGLGARERARELVRQAIFYTVMAAIDAAFYAVRAKNWLLSWRGHASARVGFEDELEAQMAQMMKAEYGVEIDPAMFEA
jgi:aarF domain-containing kinase